MQGGVDLQALCAGDRASDSLEVSSEIEQVVLLLGGALAASRDPRFGAPEPYTNCTTVCYLNLKGESSVGMPFLKVEWDSSPTKSHFKWDSSHPYLGKNNSCFLPQLSCSSPHVSGDDLTQGLRWLDDCL